jgi:hypothetical protein
VLASVHDAMIGSYSEMMRAVTCAPQGEGGGGVKTMEQSVDGRQIPLLESYARR